MDLNSDIKATERQINDFETNIIGWSQHRGNKIIEPI